MPGRSALRPAAGRPSAGSANGRRPRAAVGAAGWGQSREGGGSRGRAVGAWAAGGSMSVGRKQVFIGKVLKRLFAATPSTSHAPVPSDEEMVLKNPTSKPQQKDFENAQASSECASSPGRENEILLPRLYTVSLPPDGYIPGNPRTDSPTNAENSESSDDAAAAAHLSLNPPSCSSSHLSQIRKCIKKTRDDMFNELTLTLRPLGRVNGEKKF